MLIFELSQPGRRNPSQAPLAKSEVKDIPVNLRRSERPLLPEVSEMQAVRHYTKLSQKNFSIDTQFYPLGSCTMKYNPRACNSLAMLPQLLGRHPAAPESTGQGFLACMYELQEILKGVVERGTATNLRHAQYKIAGKTGTAQIANAGAGYKGGDRMRYQASFVGYFPADNPKYSCIVVVYAPNGGMYYASQVAGPIFKEIADKVFASSIELHKELKLEQNMAQNIPSAKNGQYRQTEKVVKTLKIPAKLPESQDRWIAAKATDDNVVFTGVKFRHDQVPNVIGMGLRDAIYLLESKGLQVKIVGRGTIVRQSVNAGTKIQKGQEIVIQLG